MTQVQEPLPTTLDAIEQEVSAIEQELRRRRWAADPDAWAREKLKDHLWSGQRRILQSIKENRRTAVATCHEIGKSYSAALVATWWIDTHKAGEAFVVTTAPTAPQVEVILWKEIGRAHMRGGLPGHVNRTNWVLTVARVGPDGVLRTKSEIVGLGRKPNDYAPDAFQGIHAPYVLVIVDEANGVRGPLWHSFDTLMANDTSKQLLIGNPDDPTGEFHDACRPNSGYNVIHISAFDSPNFTGEAIPQNISRQLIGKTYVEERRAKWAPSWTWSEDGSRCLPPEGAKLEDTHPFWQSKVLGQFPVQSGAGSLIPLSWIRAAQDRTLPPVGDNEMGLDVGASEGGDPSCLGHRRGPVFRVLYEERQPDTMKTTGRMISTFTDPRYEATRVKVDYIGVGRGVVDRAREEKLPVYPISVGEAATILRCLVCKHEWDSALLQSDRCMRCNSDLSRPVFANLLSQLWWGVRGVFERGEVDLDPIDEQLAEELLSITWEPNSKGQTVVKYGDGPSPNRADALLFTFAPVIDVETDMTNIGMTSSVTW